MPSAIDLIGHNPALQEHWIRRFLAVLIDAIFVLAIYLLFAWPLGFTSLAWYVTPFLYGIVWLLYSMLLETLWGATIGKRILSLRVVAIDGNLDIMHCLVRNISKIYWLIFLLDFIVGGVTQGDPRQRFFDRIARTTVARERPSGPRRARQLAPAGNRVARRRAGPEHLAATPVGRARPPREGDEVLHRLRGTARRPRRRQAHVRPLRRGLLIRETRGSRGRSTPPSRSSSMRGQRPHAM